MGAKKKKKIKGTNPFEAPDAVPSFLDPEFDNLDEAEQDIQAQYRGRAGDDAD